MPLEDIPLGMRAIACIPFLFATLAWADQSADRAAIERVIDAWNDGRRSADLFTADARKELDGQSIWERRPWSEETPPRLVMQSLRFVTPDVALVDASNTQFGSMILVRKAPVLLVMKKEGSAWRIAAIRP